jgi:serine/threonine protein kinase
MVWETSDQVYELLPYYEGVNLRELIERSGLTLEGETLGAIFNSLLEAANQLHEIGILHRDINPSNILLIEPKLRRKENGEGYSYNIFRLQLVLIDVTFCCDVNSPQVPVSNPSFTASEQKRGKAVVQSDWFSIAGTVYFLANGIPPQQWDEESYAHGLRRAASMGPYRPSPSFYAKFKTRFERNMALLETLLSENLSLRPSKLHEVMLQECTMPNFPPELHNILDIGDGKFLYFTDRSFFVGDISTLYHEFQVAKKAGKFISDEVYKVIRKSSIST